jgi:hypothetical protein
LGRRSSAEPIPVEWWASAPTRTFSSAVMLWKSRMFWKVRAIPILVIWNFLRRPRGSPMKRTPPDVGW